MALVPCAACGNQVSEQATACPKCGHPVDAATGQPISEPRRPRSSNTSGLGLVITLLGLLVAFGYCISKTGGGGGSQLASVSPECRAAFQRYASAVAADLADPAGKLDEKPYQSATLTSCKSGEEWLAAAAMFQSRSGLFPPRPIGGLENVLRIFCENDRETPACRN